MKSQGITNEQLIQELSLLKKEVRNMHDDRMQCHLHSVYLDHERELYEDLANALPLGIYRLRVFHDEGILAEKWNNYDNLPYCVEFVNDRFCEILNIDKQVFKKNPGILHKYIYEEDRAEFVRKNVEANRYTIPFLWEGRFLIHDELIWIHFESIPRVLDNRDTYWTGILNNINEQRKAEEELKKKNLELQRVNTEKDKFLSIIAHDLKSPFNSIIGFCGILLEKAQEREDNCLIEYAEIIKSSSQRAYNLLLNLMEWSQSQTGRMKFSPVHFDLVTIIDEIIELFENNAQQKSIHLSREMPAQLPIFADRAMVSTIVRNLLSNALKFTKEGGIIHVIAEPRSNDVFISVKDSGIGIDKSVMEKIFHIDSSFSTPDTQGNKGTGLGLMLCKEFTDRHNGTIGIESEPGRGSLFYFTIPRQK